jgi:hypothetical protein
MKPRRQKEVRGLAEFGMTPASRSKVSIKSLMMMIRWLSS